MVFVASTTLAVALGGAVRGANHDAASARPPRSSTIQHVVVIYQENHSFDETLGAYCMAHSGRCDGYVGPVHLADGTTVPMTQSPDIVPQSPHDVATQATVIDGGRMDGWSSAPKCYSGGVNMCLTYYTPSQIPNLASLADRYVISDRTFTQNDSPSFGGHLYAAAVTQDGFSGDNPHPVNGVTPGDGWGCDSNLATTWTNPASGATSQQPSCVPAPPGFLDPSAFPYNGAFGPTQVSNVPTIFDRLDARGLSWKLYTSAYKWAVCPSFAECLYGPQHTRMTPTTDIINDAQHGNLPAFSLVLPNGPGGTSQHNGTSMLNGDNWIGQIVDAIGRGRDWTSTAIFIAYDDCGCFYDHVPPGVNPDGTQQGIRTPLVIVSPFAKSRYTDHNVATFASILRFTENTFGLSPLGVNDANAYDFSNAFSFGSGGGGAPTAPRTRLELKPLPAASREYLARHPADVDDDPT